MTDSARLNIFNSILISRLNVTTTMTVSTRDHLPTIRKIVVSSIEHTPNNLIRSLITIYFVNH